MPALRPRGLWRVLSGSQVRALGGLFAARSSLSAGRLSTSFALFEVCKPCVDVVEVKNLTLQQLGDLEMA